jgi:hypothetical protein
MDHMMPNMVPPKLKINTPALVHKQPVLNNTQLANMPLIKKIMNMITQIDMSLARDHM